MGINNTFKSISLALVASSALTTVALAGGFDRGGVNIDQLFDEGRFGASAQVTYVNPQRTINNITRSALAGTPLSGFNGTSVRNDGDFVVPRLGVKTNVANGLDCLASYSEPFGGDSNYGTGNNFSPSTVEFFLDSQDYGLTCSYQTAVGETSVGESFVRFIAGGSYLEVEGFLSRQSFLFGSTALGVAPLTETGLGTFSISDETFGWRAGVAYEIPDIALRASIVYNSRYDLNLEGIQNNSGFSTLSEQQLGEIGGPTIPIALGGAEIPQSIDLKFQTGINETTLAFLNLRWQDWSQLQILPVIALANGQPTGSTLDASYSDGYTVTAGIGKTLTDNLSGLASLTWDRGTSTIVGTQSDSWTLTGGLRYEENEQLTINIGGAIGVLEGGASGINPLNGDPSSAVTFDFDADTVYAVSGGINYKF